MKETYEDLATPEARAQRLNELRERFVEARKMPDRREGVELIKGCDRLGRAAHAFGDRVTGLAVNDLKRDVGVVIFDIEPVHLRKIMGVAPVETHSLDEVVITPLLDKYEKHVAVAVGSVLLDLSPGETQDLARQLTEACSDLRGMVEAYVKKEVTS